MVLNILAAILLASTNMYSQISSEEFDFPMQTGNKWIYLEYGFPICSWQFGYHPCTYAKLEVVSSSQNEQRKCATLNFRQYLVHDFHMGENGIYFTTNGVTFNRASDIHLCQAGNQLYWFDEGILLDIELSESMMIADFNRDQTQPWVLEDYESWYILRRLIGRSETTPAVYHFESYTAPNKTDLDGAFGFEFVYNLPGYLTDGLGFHYFWHQPSLLNLRSYFVNGETYQDTTFLYHSVSITHTTTLPNSIELIS